MALPSRDGGGLRVQCVLVLRSYRQHRIKQLAGFQYLLREPWIQLEALVVKPWASRAEPRPCDFFTKADADELATNDPVEDHWPFFLTWEAAPAEYHDGLRKQREPSEQARRDREGAARPRG